MSVFGRFTLANGITKTFFKKSYEEIALQLFVSPKHVYWTISTFLNTRDVKPCRLGRQTGSITLFPHEEYIIMDFLVRSPQMQLHEVANHISNATGSAFGPRTLCRAVYRLGITPINNIQYISAKNAQEYKPQ